MPSVQMPSMSDAFYSREEEERFLTSLTQGSSILGRVRNKKKDKTGLGERKHQSGSVGPRAALWLMRCLIPEVSPSKSPEGSA